MATRSERAPECRGTRTTYNAGCRCEECTAANARYKTEWSNRTGRTDPTLDCRLRPSPHGALNRYNHGCRCAECRAANTRMRQQSRGPATAPRSEEAKANIRAARWPEYYGGAAGG